MQIMFFLNIYFINYIIFSYKKWSRLYFFNDNLNTEMRKKGEETVNLFKNFGGCEIIIQENTLEN